MAYFFTFGASLLYLKTLFFNFDIVIHVGWSCFSKYCNCYGIMFVCLSLFCFLSSLLAYVDRFYLQVPTTVFANTRIKAVAFLATSLRSRHWCWRVIYLKLKVERFKASEKSSYSFLDFSSMFYLIINWEVAYLVNQAQQLKMYRTKKLNIPFSTDFLFIWNLRPRQTSWKYDWMNKVFSFLCFNPLYRAFV